MSQLSIVNGSRLFAAATAISAVGFLTVPAPARADAACTQYQFMGVFDLVANGYSVHFLSRGRDATGPVDLYKQGPTMPLVMRGTVSGGIQGRHLDFTIVWDGGAKGHYWGDVAAVDDYVRGGQSIDEGGPGSSASWHSQNPLGCVLRPPLGVDQDLPISPPQTPAPAPLIALTANDVDVYDVPGGKGKIIGMLRAERQVQVVGSCKPQDWCNVVALPDVPGGQGWVWGNLRLE
jgi:hypothetical protein